MDQTFPAARLPSPDSVIATAREILEAAYYSFVITLDDRGTPTSRLLQHFDPDPDLTVRFGTSEGSRKVGQIEANPHVLVSCQNPGNQSYVAINGRAEIRRDEETKARFWREPWSAIWPSGPLGEEYLIIEVRPLRVEVVDLTPGTVFSSATPRIVERQGREWGFVGEE